MGWNLKAASVSSGHSGYRTMGWHIKGEGGGRGGDIKVCSKNSAHQCNKEIITKLFSNII